MEFAKDDLQVIQVIKDDSGPFFIESGCLFSRVWRLDKCNRLESCLQVHPCNLCHHSCDLGPRSTPRTRISISFPYTSQTTRLTYGSGMGSVWGMGVAFLGVPGTSLNAAAEEIQLKDCCYYPWRAECTKESPQKAGR